MSDLPPSAAPPPASSSEALAPVSILEIFLTFLIIGATSFGGGVVAYLRNALVEQKGWLDEEEFLTALEISQALPGLNATNMSVIVGDRLRGPVGAIAGFVGMTLPGGLLVFALGIFYVSNHGNPAMHSVLAGIGAASVGLLAAVTLQIGHKQLEHLREILLIVITVVMVSFLHISLIIVLLTVLPLGLYVYRPRDKAAGTSTPEGHK
ncbi:chromate transporter [Xanthobacter autotrophicus DSM 431]|uniref:chromate transporter n=1 Tax=Xanthobacter nonsaccharivorans TaxID=3119912 RepID=UPI0037285701